MDVKNIIPGHSVSVKSPNQILNMGGPWIADLYIDGKFVSNAIHIDNLIFDFERNRLFIVKFVRKYFQ